MPVGRVAARARRMATCSASSTFAHARHQRGATLKPADMYDLLRDSRSRSGDDRHESADPGFKRPRFRPGISRKLIAWAKANQDKVSIGTGRRGYAGACQRRLLQEAHRYPGADHSLSRAAPAMQDLFAGHIDLYFDQAVSAVPNSRAGRVKPYAVTAKTAPGRSARYSDGRRGRAARFLHGRLARHLGAQGDAERCRGQVETRPSPKRLPILRCASAWKISARNPRASSRRLRPSARTTRPRSTRRLRTAGSASASVMAEFNLATTSFGVALGAQMACQTAM